MGRGEVARPDGPRSEWVYLKWGSKPLPRQEV